MQVVVDPLFPLAGSAHKHASNYPSHLSPAYKIYDSAVTVLWQLASCPAVYLLPPHSYHYRFSWLHCLLFLQWLEPLPRKWEAHGHVTPLA